MPVNNSTTGESVMNYDQATGLVRALCPAIFAYCVGRGWISASDVGEYTAAAVAIAACIWSYVNNKTGNVSGAGGLNIGKNPGGAIGAAIIGLFLVYGGSAHAADVAPPMVAKAPVAVPATGCQQLSCTGFSMGGVIYGI